MKKIIELKEKFTPAADKLAHFYWGFVYAAITLLVCFFIDLRLYNNFNINLYNHIPIAVFGVPAAIGYLEEKWDAEGKGNCDFLDLLFTAIPSVIISLILIYINF